MSRILAHYDVAAPAAEIEARAAALALEQSIEMPLVAVTSNRIRHEVVASVERVEPLDAGDGAGAQTHRVVLGLSPATIVRADGTAEIGQLVNMAFGNCSLQDDVTLVDIELPAELLTAWPGPRFGLDGLRSQVGAAGERRPLTMTALKPQGLPPAELAALAATFARAGLDIVKDDHGIADQGAAPFAARVAACQRAISEANAATGGHTVYAPSLSGGPRQLAEQARIVADEGVGAVLACPMLMGLPTFDELVRHELACPVVAHPAFGGAGRMAPPLLLGRLFRLLGADATIFPNHGGRFSYSSATCARLAEVALEPWGHLRPCAPVPAGGMTVDRVPEMLSFYGLDVILLIGGGLLSAGAELEARAREFAGRVRSLEVPTP